jgi:RimJ/RimL family protein N-acetyltransferase
VPIRPNLRRGTLPGVSPDPGPTLRTDRLVLRRWRAADRPPFARLNADPEVMRHFVHPLTRAESDALVDRIEAQFEARGYGLWAVERQADGVFLGFTGLADFDFGEPARAYVEIGWRFDRFAWGQGYATEAASEVLRFGFEVAGLAEIASWTSPLNTPSVRVMERLGLHRDPADDFDHPRVPEGHPLRRHVLYRLTRAEWLARPPAPPAPPTTVKPSEPPGPSATTGPTAPAGTDPTARPADPTGSA